MGFSAAVPDSWQSFDLTQGQLKASFALLAKSNPDLAGLASALADTNFLFAAGLFGPNGLPPIVMSMNLTPQIHALNRSQSVLGLRQSGATNIHVTKARLGGAPAESYTSTLPNLRLPDGTTLTLYTVQYDVVSKKGLVVISFDTPDNDHRDQAVKTIAKTIRIKH